MDVVLVPLLLTSNRFDTLLWCFYCRLGLEWKYYNNNSSIMSTRKNRFLFFFLGGGEGGALFYTPPHELKSLMKIRL